MSNKPNESQPDTKPEPSKGPLENEPTPKHAAEHKQQQEQQAAEIAQPKPSGAV